MNNTYNSKLTSNAKRLRREMTQEERHLWYDFLKQLPVTVHRQKILGNFIVDFYIACCKIVIEIDGSQHYEEKDQMKDAIRTEKLEQRNLSVIRIPNNEINRNFRGVCEYIDWFIHNTV